MTRWLLGVAIVAAVVAATSLGAAIAAAETDAPRALAAVALVAVLVAAVAAGAWGSAGRSTPKDPLAERADTAASMAHELRSPLMSIKGLASTGVRLFDRMSEDERREFFRLIDEESSRLGRVIDQSSAAMAVAADRIEYDLRREDLAALVEAVAWAAPHGDHPITVACEPGISIDLDRGRLTDVIESLIDNAAKYSPPDAPIDVAVRHEDGETIIEVADRGPGIPLDHQETVFERFARWRPAGYEETPGAGLGLFLARAHVSAHGGTIDIVEREEGGSILRVSLPGGGSD